MTIRQTAFALVLGCISAVASADAAQPYEGEVAKVDAASGRVTLKHGPIAKFDMDAMTMGYRVADPAMLKDVKSGDKVTFDVEGSDGSYTVTRIEKVK